MSIHSFVKKFHKLYFYTYILFEIFLNRNQRFLKKIFNYKEVIFNPNE